MVRAKIERNGKLKVWAVITTSFIMEAKNSSTYASVHSMWVQVVEPQRGDAVIKDRIIEKLGGSYMYRSMLLLAAAGLSLVGSTVAAAETDCRPGLSVLTASEFKDYVQWGRERAVAERTLEYHNFEETHHDDRLDQLASHLTDARYHVALAEIEQLELGRTQQARDELRQASQDIDEVMKGVTPDQRSKLAHAKEAVQRIEKNAVACNAPAREEARYFYKRAELALHQVLKML